MPKLSRKTASAEDGDDTIKFEYKTMNPDAVLRPELREKIEKWILSFYHLDPRYKILTFFNLVAQEGADNITDDQVDEQNSYAVMQSNGNAQSDRVSSLSDSSGSPRSSARKGPAREAFKVNARLMNRASARNIRPSTLSLLSSLFNVTSILTVWRPCSNDAMRKMMEGTGVGKGLDIKGKSAKKGELSAFVPFMQIFNNEHKYEITPIGESAEMRIYYKTEKLRDYVFEVLQNYLENGPPERKTKTEVGDGDPVSPSLSRQTSVVRTYGGEEMMDEAMIASDAANWGNESDDALKEIEEDVDNESDAAQETEPATEAAYDSSEKTTDEMWVNEDAEVSDEEDDRLPPHKDPDSPSYLSDSTKLKRVKKFAKKGFWGIECSQRLFWFATIEPADITRVGTGTETGRPSLPAFQDANMKTLKVAQSQLPKPSPMPVLMQHKGEEELRKDLEARVEEAKEQSDEVGDCNPLDGCLDPRFLLMAYEEQGTIKPVVSDFDGFLLGWRREALWFGCNLPQDQEKLMMWSVKHIEEILDDQKRNPTNSDSWTIRWLDVMKKNTAEGGYSIDMPEYGFGDPKSTSIMEHAALKLKSTGAVRHGSECFNYGFPQEIDEMFLLISDTLKPVPWKYVNVRDLQEILSKKIAEGFVFPMNPKWILCDPGWKKIYDDLMASEALYADLSKDVWFPPYSGIRERIEAIHKNHPNGFQRCTDPTIANKGNTYTDESESSHRRQSAKNLLRDEGLGSELTGNAFADLAQLEYDDFVGRNKHSSFTIDEVDEEALSEAFKSYSKTAKKTMNRTWRSPNKSEKRPSHSSISSRESDSLVAPSSNRSVGQGEKLSGSSTHSTKKTKAPLRKLLRVAAESTRKIMGTERTRSRPTTLGKIISESDDEQDDVTLNSPKLRTQSCKSHLLESQYQVKTSSSLKKYRSMSQQIIPDEDEAKTLEEIAREKMENSKSMNKEPRRHFGVGSKWNKIRQNLKNK